MSRITPAYAGKTQRLFATCVHTRDHPRVCGENKEKTAKTVAAQGSPPRMRGKHVRTVTSALIARITPAYAGKTATPSE